MTATEPHINPLNPTDNHLLFSEFDADEVSVSLAKMYEVMYKKIPDSTALGDSLSEAAELTGQRHLLDTHQDELDPILTDLEEQEAVFNCQAIQKILDPDCMHLPKFS